MDENPVVGPVNPESTAPVREKRSLWQVILSSRSKTFGILAIIVVIAAIPLTVIVSQQQQEIRQRAEGPSCLIGGERCEQNAACCSGICDSNTRRCAVSVPPTPGPGEYVFCSNTPLNIPDYSSAYQDLVVTEGGAVRDLNLLVDAAHTYVGNLRFTLQRQTSGVPYRMINYNRNGDGTCSGNNINVLLDDQASSTVDNVCNESTPAISGTRRPNQPLSNFNSQDLAATWRLTVYDNRRDHDDRIDTGIVNRWCLIFTKSPVTPTPTPTPTSAPTPTPTPTPFCVALGGSCAINTLCCQGQCNPINQTCMYINTTPTPTPTSTYTISGYVFIDSNGNGTKDSSEPYYTTGKTVALFSYAKGNPADYLWVDNVSSSYTFSNQPPGQYSLTLSSVPSDYTIPDNPHVFTLNGNYTHNFRIVPTTPTPAPVNGACGGSAKAYSESETTWPDSTWPNGLCLVGDSNPVSPAFPAIGSTTSWTCQGTNGGTNANCSASRGNMILAFNVGLDGIGAAGDHPLPCTSLQTCTSNKNPRRTARDLNITFLQNKDYQYPDQKITITYDAATGTFKGNASANLAPGNYTIKVKSPGLLRKTLINIQALVAGTNQIPSGNLTNGDINTQEDSNNALDVLDYNVLISCWVYSNDHGTLCNSVAEYRTLSDLNDNGTIDEIDYNLFLREFSVQNGD